MVAELGCHAYEPSHPAPVRGVAGPTHAGMDVGGSVDRGGGGRGLGYTGVSARSLAGCLYSRIDFRRISVKNCEKKVGSNEKRDSSSPCTYPVPTAARQICLPASIKALMIVTLRHSEKRRQKRLLGIFAPR